MASVTQRIRQIKQPQGGYVKRSQLKSFKFEDNLTLNNFENVKPYIAGLCVDYLTRLMIGTNKKETFEISYLGALNAGLSSVKLNIPCMPTERAEELLSKINGLDKESVYNACKMVSYDEWYRNPVQAMKNAREMAKRHNKFNLDDEIMPNDETIENIQIMVKRSIDFLNRCGSVKKTEFTFEPSGYTSTVDAGDGDFLTEKLLCDLKVSKFDLRQDIYCENYTLQLLMYWIMGQHSGQEIYKGITKLGIFNPRLNTAYLIKINDISPEIIKEVEKNVICYE